MDIDTTPASHHDNRPTMQLDIPPPDEVMMEVDPDMSLGPALSPQDFHHQYQLPAVLSLNHSAFPSLQVPSPTKSLESMPLAARCLPNPPSAVITASDVYSWPQLKLDQLFIEWYARPDSQAWIKNLLQDLSGGKSNIRFSDAANRSSRLERSQSPGRSRSPSASQVNTSVSPQQAPNSPLSKLFRMHIPFDDSDSSPRSPPATPALVSGAVTVRPGASSHATTSMDLGKSGSLSPVRSDLVANKSSSVSSILVRSIGSVVQSEARASELPSGVDSWSNKSSKNTIKELVHHSKTEEGGKISGDAVEVSAAGSSDGRSCEDSRDIPPSSTMSVADSKQIPFSVEGRDGNEFERKNADIERVDNLVPDPEGQKLDTGSEEISRELDAKSINDTSERAVAPTCGSELEVQTNGNIINEYFSEIDKSQNLSKVSEASQKPTVKTTVSTDASSAECENAQSLSPQDMAMSDVSSQPRPCGPKRKCLPTFYFPCGRDVEARERKERESLTEYFKRLRVQKKMNVVSRSDIAELVVEVVGLPSYFAKIVFNLIFDQFPPKSGDENMRDADGREEDSSSSCVSGMDRGGGPMAAEEAYRNNTDAKMAEGDRIADAGKDIGGLSSDVKDEANKQDEYVTEDQFRAFYRSRCVGQCREARLFYTLLGRARRSYLIPSDFKPLMRSLLSCHQGLAFLHATPEFQQRYSETVIERIYFGCTKQHNGRLNLADIKRSKLLDTLMTIDEEEDINRERRFFSYEHFYVLYCRFWELDANHDLQIDKEDLMRYSSHSLTTRIVDRIFSGHARPLDAPHSAGFMSYTDFIWFCLSEEDKTSETAIDYWFRCIDMDGDGIITMYDMEYFYKEQLFRMESFGHEPVQIKDILCQLLDMISPNMNPPLIRRRDLKKSRLAGNFFNILFNLNKFFTMEARDPLQIRQEHATPELTDWDRFAALEYLRLSADEEGEEDESWEEVGDAANPLMAGEAPF